MDNRPAHPHQEFAGVPYSNAQNSKLEFILGALIIMRTFLTVYRCLMVNVWSKCTDRKCLIEKVRYIVMHLYGTFFAGFEKKRNWRNAIPLLFPLFLALFTLFPALGPFLKFREVLVRETRITYIRKLKYF